MSKSGRPNQLNSFVLENLFGLDHKLLDPEMRKLLGGPQSIKGILAKKAVDSVTPQFVTTLKKQISLFKTRKFRRARELVEAKKKLLAEKRGGSSDIDFILNQLSSNKTYDAGEKNLLKVIQATNNPALLERFWKTKESSSQERLSPLRGSSKSFLSSLAKNKDFKQAYRKIINGEDINLRGSGGLRVGRDQTHSIESLGRSLGIGDSLSSSGSSSELQELTYKVMKSGFKDTNENLKKILNVLRGGGIGASGEGIGVGEVAAGGALAYVAKKAKGAFGAIKKVGKLGLKGLGPALLAHEVYTDRKAINRAEGLGMFTPEEASNLRKKAYVKSAVGGVAAAGAGAFGTFTAGPVGTAAGGVVGWNFGQQMGGVIGEGMFGHNVDREKAYLATVANIESGLNASPKATGTSTARGLFQFTEGTWNQLNKKYKKGYALGGSVDPRLDPKKSIEMMKLLTYENQSALEGKLGRKVTDTELYMAHFLGPNGAARLIGGGSDISAAELLPAAAGSNPNIFYKNGAARSANDVKALISEKYRVSAGGLNLSSDKRLPIAVPELSTNSTTPTISDMDLSNYSKQEKEASVTAATNVSTALDSLSKSTAANASKQNISIATAGGGGGNNQSLFSDISSIHFLDGMLLNILTD